MKCFYRDEAEQAQALVNESASDVATVVYEDGEYFLEISSYLSELVVTIPATNEAVSAWLGESLY